MAELCIFCLDQDGLPKLAKVALVLADGLLLSLPLYQYQYRVTTFLTRSYNTSTFNSNILCLCTSLWLHMTVCVRVCVCMQIMSFSVSLCWQFLFCPLLNSLDSFLVIIIYRIYTFSSTKKSSFNHDEILKLVNPFTATAMVSLENDQKKSVKYEPLCLCLLFCTGTWKDFHQNA